MGILLLHGASRYCEDRKSPVAGSSNESSPSSNDNVTRCGVGGDVIVGVGGKEVRQRTSSTVRKTAEHRKQRSLSEVERYTLVSNRIV